MKQAFALGWVLIAAAVVQSSPVSAMGKFLASRSEIAAMPELREDYPRLPVLGEGQVLMIFAHPDDELQVLSQVARIHREDPKRTIRWIMVSDAGAGMVLPFTCIGKTKTQCRMQEAADAGHCVGLSAPEQMLLPDGKLNQYPYLQEDIEAQITGGDGVMPEVAAIFSSDAAGLYGHPDHIAVHDASLAIAEKYHIPFVSGALPELFDEVIPIKEAGAELGRKRPPINAIMDMTQEEQSQAACAAMAHESQRILVEDFLQFLPAREFYETSPRVFMNISTP